MIVAKLHKAEISGLTCAHPQCQHLPEYTVNIIGQVYHIKTDTTVVSIGLSGGMETYCGGCIDDVYHRLKSVLDKNLWAFH